MKQAIAILGLILLIGCTTARPSLVCVRAEVVRFVPGAMHDDYSDGRRPTFFDAVEFRIASPEKWKGKKLTVFCDPEKPNATLQTVGTAWQFRIREELILGQSVDPKTRTLTEYLPFEGALHDLTEIK
jgi:hypothetical protein